MDRYTKITLTVIAGALSVIALQRANILPAFAEADDKPPIKVQICGYYPLDKAYDCAAIRGHPAGLAVIPAN